MWQGTFVRAKWWVEKLKKEVSPGIVIALAGNKTDLPANKRDVDFEVGFIKIFTTFVLAR